MEITYSFIIPSKNIPHLLKRCIESIPVRDDIEVIVIDDNSDASIVDFNHYPGLDNSNVKVIFSKEGKGAGAARNIGLKNATGKWLLFADSDDLFENGFLNTIDKYKDSFYDIVYFGVLSRDSDSLCVIDHDYRSNSLMRHLQDAYEHKNFDNLRWASDNSLNVPWGKMIRRELVRTNNIYFDEVIAGNDAMFSCKCGFAAQSITCDLSVIYNVTLRSDSLTQTFSKQVLASRFDTTCRINMYLRSIDKDDFCYNLYELSCSHFYRYPKELMASLIKAAKVTPLEDSLRDILECMQILIKKISHMAKNRR